MHRKFPNVSDLVSNANTNDTNVSDFGSNAN